MKKVAQKFLFVNNYSYIYTIIKNLKIYIMKNSIFYIICGISCLIITLGIMRGTVQEYIHFAGAKNEIGTCILLLMLTVGFFISAVPSKIKTQK